MTPKQNTLYWREWQAARKAGQLEDSDRYALHAEALGEHKSSKDLTNEDLDKVLAAFRAISRPSSLNTQLRQQDQPRQRLLHRIQHQITALSIFVEHPCSYLSKVLKDRFSADDLEDLRTAGTPGPDDAIPANDLIHLRNTLARCLSRLRNKGELSPRAYELYRPGAPVGLLTKLTEHEMCQLAGVPCFHTACAECRKKAQNAAAAARNCPAPIADCPSTPEPELAEDPF